MRRSVVSRKKKRRAAVRANHYCEYCRCPESHSPSSFSVEHILPRIRGGSDELENLAFACQGCNNRKYSHTTAIDPASGQTVDLYNPRTQLWADHFVWREGFTELIGLTAVGRATISRLGLNRPNLINLRGALVAVQVHPPE